MRGHCPAHEDKCSTSLFKCNHSFFQFTSSETYCVRQVSTELQVYKPDALSEGVVGRLKLDGMTSFQLGPGDKPSIAVFCGEKKVRRRVSSDLTCRPSCQCSFSLLRARLQLFVSTHWPP